MNRTRHATLVSLTCAILVPFGSQAAPFPEMYNVEIDVASFGLATEFRINYQLFDLSGTTGDSFLLLDNLHFRNAAGVTVGDVIGFESGTLEGFSNSFNPTAVSVVSDGLGSGMALRMDEDPGLLLTITERDLMGMGASVLSFDLGFSTTGASGLFGPDVMVASFLDGTGTPFISGLTGNGDFLSLSSGVVSAFDGVSVSPLATNPVPEPATVALLGGSLLGWLFVGGRRKKKWGDETTTESA